MKKQDQKLSQAMEDYLETIYVLSKTKGYARTGEIARSLNVSPSSVVEMVGKISKLGYVEWRRYEGVFLSPEGRMRGEVIHIRHETLRQFFEFIGVAPDIANKEACVIEHELSPITTSAIGNLVRFLNTPAGSQTLSALELFLKIQDAGLPWEQMAITPELAYNEMVVKSAMKSQANMDILSVITRHDLLNTITALHQYLDLLKTMSTGNEMNLVVSRIESTVQAINRQISSSSEHLIPGFSGQKWMDLANIISNAITMIDVRDVVIEYSLSSIEIYGDTLLEKVVFNLIDNAIRHGGGVSHIISGYLVSESNLIWYIQDDGQGIPDNEKALIFKALNQNNPDSGLYLAYQVLNACGMYIHERGIYGQGARFEITIPKELFRVNKTKAETVKPAYKLSQ